MSFFSPEFFESVFFFPRIMDGFYFEQLPGRARSLFFKISAPGARAPQAAFSGTTVGADLYKDLHLFVSVSFQRANGSPSP